MSPKPAKPWDIYASQLEPLGYGYPLWVPDPQPGAAQVEIGDVGWIHEGEFIPLFNVFRGGDETQPKARVPEGHVPLNPRDLATLGPREKILQPILFSHSVKKSNGSGGANAAIAPVSVSGKFELKFDCTDDAGALLLLGPSARTHEILAKDRLVRYILQNFDRWMMFANNHLELGLREDQLIFVSGTTKTSHWAVASFSGKTHSQSGTINGNVGSVAGLDISLSFSDAQVYSNNWKAGPPKRDKEDAVYDQCVFIHYYKRKQRPIVISLFVTPRIACLSLDSYASSVRYHYSNEASAVPIEKAERTSRPPDRGATSGNTNGPTDKERDLADHALDYILASTGAHTGIASDADFFCAFAPPSSNAAVGEPDDACLPHTVLRSSSAAILQTGVISADQIACWFESVERQAGNRSPAFSSPSVADREREEILDRLLRGLIGDHFVGAVREGLCTLNPEEHPLVLDLGTGEGHWMTNMALELPHVKFYGLDTSLSPSHPIPPNVNYTMLDINKPLRAFRGGAVKMVHARSIGAIVKDYPKLLREAARTLRRGGLFVSGEWGDFLAMADGSDVSLRAPRACAFFTAVRETLHMRRDLESVVSRIPGYLQESGQFKDIEAQRFHAPIGDWPDDPETKKLGHEFAQMMVQYARSVRADLLRGPLHNYADVIVDGLVWDVEHVPGLVSVYYTVHAVRA